MKESCKLCRGIFTKKYRAQVFCSVSCANRSNLNNKKEVLLPLSYSVDLAELFGILLGDGSVTPYFIKIYLNRIADKDYVPFVIKLIKRLFPNGSVSNADRPSRGTAEIQISSVDISRYLVKLGFDPKQRSIPKWITHQKTFMKAAIRGLFDTEGSIGIKYFKGKRADYSYRQLTFTNRNQNILKFIERSLRQCGFSPTKKARRNIYISNQQDIEKYMLDIGTHNPKLLRKSGIKGNNLLVI